MELGHYVYIDVKRGSEIELSALQPARWSCEFFSASDASLYPAELSSPE